MFQISIYRRTSQIYGVKNQEDFLEANYIYGLNNLLTLYGGTILSDNYNAITLGNGWNTPLGAISFDATRSSSKLNNDTRHEGTSYQVAYNKYLLQTATHFSVAAWRYASQDYRTFSDHLYENDKYDQSDYDDFYDIGRKNSLSANIMQPLSIIGKCIIKCTLAELLGRSGNAKDYQFSYSNNWQHISYTFSVSQSMMKTIKKRSVLICLSPFLSTGVMILPKHVTKLTYRILPHFPKMAIPPTILELLA
ncbi:fimbria/pilus outer membrane usher protein [Escherichia coli]